MSVNKEIFRAYDIRGDSLSDVTPDLAYKIGFCFAKMTITSINRSVCIGRDGRLSSPTLHQALITGITKAGAKIIDIGIVPSPVLYFADKQFNPASSIMITASHNPKNDNGFKMIANGCSFFANQIQELLNEILKTDWTESDFKEKPIIKTSIQNITDSYIDKILGNININPKLKIAWDPGNGAAGNITKILQTKLPNQNIVINEIIDGNFPNHHPDPTKEKNLQQLLQIVKEQDCDLGIAFDGDADRIGIVTKNGYVPSDKLLCIFAKDIIKQNPQAKVILDVKASQMILEQIKSYGGEPIMHRTGHPFIKNKMQETGALIAGEMSGHIFFADKYYGYDDGIYAALRLLNILSKSTKSLDEMLQEFPKTYLLAEIKIPVSDKLKFDIINQIKQKLIKDKVNFTDIDGVRVSTKFGWWLLRASNTEAAIIALAESSSSEGLKNLEIILQALIKKYAN